MQDQQNQQRTEQTTRRRRAVRSVPMGNPNEITASQPPQAAVQPDVQKPQETPVMKAPVPEIPTQTAADPVSDARTAEAPASTVPAQTVSELQNPAPDNSPKTEAKTSAPAKENTPVQPKKQAPVRTAAADDTFSVERTFSHQTTSPKKPAFPIGALAVTAAVIVVICIIAIMPFLGKTEAVMLYIDDNAVGYLEHEDAAADQLTRVMDDLQPSDILDPGAALYRCETEQVRGAVDYLSSDDVYDALMTQATDGYVRAYYMYRDGGVVSDEKIGVLTEAEIFAARDAVISYYTELYTPNLPAGAELSVAPNYTEFHMWSVGWIPESALMDAEQLAAAWIETQDIYPRFNIYAYRTETEAERIPYETTLVPNDENFDGIRTMISPGADGLAQVTYKIWLDSATGEELRREETSRVVVREPVSAVSYEGLYPLPDGVSTGTFDWPLPDLPDDELPLDENGNPYMPENPLALKNTYVSSGYGERDLWGTYDFHLGLDIVAPAYTEIYAADGGVVVYAAYTSSYGYMTRIRHADNVETVYAHQIKQVVKPGDVVQKGQLIGYVGSTGNTSGNHLHLEFRRDHVTVDPLEYIEIPEEITVLGEGY